MKRAALVHFVVTVSVLIALPCAAQQLTQDFVKAKLHVTSVRSEEAKDWCTTGKCSATRFLVEGFIDSDHDLTSVEYLLKCVEVTAFEPSPHFTLTCDHLHANSDYIVKVFDDAIGVYHEEPSPPVHAIYEIVSEKEVPRKKAR